MTETSQRDAIAAIYGRPHLIYGQIHNRPPVELGIADLIVHPLASLEAELLAAAEKLGVHYTPYEKVFAVPVAAAVRLRTEEEHARDNTT